LAQLWPNSVEYSNIKSKYEAAETQAIIDLATQLSRAKTADCKAYNALLTQERTLKPAHVTIEAARRTPCVLTVCFADALADKGQEQYAMSHLAAALAYYEAAYACRPSPQWAEKAFVISCNLASLAKAKLHWRHLPPNRQSRALEICVRNQISKGMLNAL
jgi:hypothetical protein